jgi:hypothetical protein
LRNGAKESPNGDSFLCANAKRSLEREEMRQF